MQPGDLIGDQFELIRRAGAGGGGEIWQARDRLRGALVALKSFTGTDETARASFTREALVLAQLTHPRIVRYVAHGITRFQQGYLVMEWLEGENLAQRLKRGRLSTDETIILLSVIADALAAAHARGFVHRDIKPSNLFLPGGSIERITILDFGIARRGDAQDSLIRTGALLGTPAYMAPEQVRNDDDVDVRADVFALGCVAFECLTGRRAFDGQHTMAVFAKILLEEVPPIAHLLPDVQPRLSAFVQRMLHKDRAQRPQDAIELSTALTEWHARKTGLTSPLPSVLTGSEQRVLAIVLVSARDGVAPTAEEARAARGIVEERSARLEQLADGSLLAVFTRKGGASDLAAQAAQCALAMRGVLPGRSMALTLGRGASDAEFAGEAVDRATRLLLDADGTARRDLTTGIVLDDVTAGLLDTRFDMIGVHGGFELSGQLEFEEAPRTLLGKVTECVGRERETAALEAIFAECATASVARAVLVTAPAGTGKSRLRNEFVTRLRRRPDAHAVEVWTGRGDPMRTGSAFGLIAQLLRQACGISEAEPIEQRQQRLRTRVARHVTADGQRVLEFLGELIGAPFSDQHSPQLHAARQDPMLLGDQMRRAWEDFVAAETETRAVVLIFEDLHWVDLPSVKLVDSVLRNLRGRPIMVLGLARGEVHDRFPNLWAEREVQEVWLSALTRKASTRLVRGALGTAVSEDTVRRIVERAEGNAFYLEELIRAVAEGRGAALPETIVATVQARLERLDPGARRILRAASVFGQTFWKDGTAELLGSATDLGERLSQLMAEEIISKQSAQRFAGEEEYGFRHALLREGAYAMLTAEDSALGHRIAGEWLERRGERDAMVLAEHFERAGIRERALAFYPRAAEQALEGNDLEGVLARIDRGIACGARGVELGVLRGIQAEAHNWRGENAEGERCAVEAMELLPPGAAAWYAAAREGIITAGKLGRDERVIEIVGAVRPLPADSATTNAHRMALGWGAMFLLFNGRYAAAEALLDDLRASAGAAQAAEPRVEAVVTKSRAVWSVMQHRPEALALLKAALDGFEQAGDLRNACSTRVDIGVVYVEFGAYEAAEPLFRRSLSDAEHMNLYTSIPQVKLNLGCALMRLGKLDAARDLQVDAASALAAQGQPALEGVARTYLAMILLNMRAFDEAELAAREALELLTATPFRAFALAALARVLVGQGRSREALAAAEDGMTELRALGTLEEGESLVRLAFTEALHAVGDVRARAAAQEANQALLARAAGIEDAEHRRTFLERIEENARTISLAHSSEQL